MKYDTSNTLICIDHTKDACLFFNEVIPLNLAHVIPWEGNGDTEAFDILKAILPTHLLDASHPAGLKPAVISYIEAYVNTFPTAIGIKEFADKEAADKRARQVFPILMQQRDQLISSLPQPVNNIFGAEPISDKDITQEDPAFILSGLQLIDTSSMSWNHILELRQDPESLKKLRCLRTFIFENYQDRPLAFIKDDLLNRMDNYEEVTRKWGLKTKDAVLKIIFNSGTAVAATAATIASIISGVPLAVSLPLGIGSTFLAGSIGVEISSYKRDLHLFKQESPITYLIDISRIV